MKIVTLWVHPDEECHGLFEGPRNGRWITAVYVIRGDAIAEHVIDHGPEIEFCKIPPMMMPSFGENRVGEMLEWGERHRHDTRWWDRAQEMKAESTLIRDVMNQEEDRIEAIHNRTQLGPYQNTQRNDYSRTANQRRFNEQRAKHTGRAQL